MRPGRSAANCARGLGAAESIDDLRFHAKRGNENLYVQRTFSNSVLLARHTDFRRRRAVGCLGNRFGGNDRWPLASAWLCFGNLWLASGAAPARGRDPLPAARF